MMAEVHDGLRAKASGLVDPAISDNVPLAGDADRILQKAVDEAAASRQERADPEHILLALLTESKGLSVETLQKHGVVTANVRAYLKTREVGR
jgi:ATP-dependent Clp protease ATP-binding subunit ClpA